MQPYDGGGFGLAGSDDRDWWHFATSIAAASDDFIIFNVPENTIFRWMAADAVNLAGNNPTGQFFVQDELIGGAISATAIVTIPLLNFGVAMEVFTPVLGPNSDIRFHYQGGNAPTQVLARIYGALAPIGTSFNV